MWLKCLWSSAPVSLVLAFNSFAHIHARLFDISVARFLSLPWFPSLFILRNSRANWHLSKNCPFQSFTHTKTHRNVNEGKGKTWLYESSLWILDELSAHSDWSWRDVRCQGLDLNSRVLYFHATLCHRSWTSSHRHRIHQNWKPPFPFRHASPFRKFWEEVKFMSNAFQLQFGCRSYNMHWKLILEENLKLLQSLPTSVFL